MKIRCLAGAALVAALITSAGAAARPARAQAAAGVKAGANFAGLSGAVETETVTGLTAGAYLGFGIGDRLALQFEVNYEARGGGAVPIGANALDDAASPSDIRLAYVEVPVLFRAGYPGERLLPTVFVGPYAAFLTSCRLTLGDGAEGTCDDETRASWFEPRTTDYGLLLGAGLDLALGESTIFVDARYALGLRSIQRGDDALDLRNGGFTIAGGFAIPLGR